LAGARRLQDRHSLLIENLHAFSNIHVIDVKGAAYGYGGLTQEYVLHHPGNATFLEVQP
jgi:hypothetical protein